MAEPNVSALIQDGLIGHQVDLIKLEGTVRKDVLAVLTELEGDILKRLNAVDPTAPALTAYQQKRLETLLAQVQKVTGSGFAKARRVTNGQLLQLAEMETGLATGQFQAALGTEVGLPHLNRQRLQEIVNDGFIQGAPSREWWAKQAADTVDKFRQEMRLGTLAGESVGKLTTRVRKIMDLKRYQAEALVRTSVNSVANLTRLRTYQENAHLIKAIKWVSTLDSRTTDTCKALDGLLWDVTTYEPIGHSVSFPGPTAHWNCRSTQVPITYSWQELSKNKSKKAQRLAKQLDSQGTNARSSLDGRVPASITYENWLALKEKAQPGWALSSGALTPSKYSLWKQGKLNFKDLVDQTGNSLTVKELRDRLKDIIPTTALPAAALAAQQAVSAETAAFNVKQAKAEADKKLAAEALAARVQAAKEAAAINAKKQAQEALLAMEDQATAPSSYHFKALKEAKKAHPGAFANDFKDDPVGLLDYIEGKAASKKLSTDLSHYKAKVIEGKKPGPAAQAAFDALPEEAQKDVLDAIQVKQAELAAQAAAEKAAAERLAAIKAANEAAGEEIAAILANPKGKTKLAGVLKKANTDPDLQGLSTSKLLEAAKKKAEFLQAQATKSTYISEYKKKALAGETPSPTQLEVITSLSEEELATVKDQIKQLKADLDEYKKAAVIGDEPTKSQAAAYKFLTKTGKKTVDKEVADLKKAVAEAAAKVQAQVQAQGAGLTQEQLVESYKYKAIIGEVPNSAETAAVINLKGNGLADLLDEIGAAKQAGEIPPPPSFLTEAAAAAEPAATPTVAGAQAAAEAVAKPLENPILSSKTWTKTRNKDKGSVPGVFMRDEAGQEWLVKFTASDDIARNEVLTAKLYNAAGIETPDLRLIRLDKRAGGRAGGIGVASRVQSITEVGPAELARLEGTYEGFAADAWLADWDVVGLSYDNIVRDAAGKALRIDVGAGLRYRAQGGVKGAAFGDEVTELESLRNQSTNLQAYEVFKDVPQAKIEAGVAKIISITDDTIDDLVRTFGPEDVGDAKELARRLKARRDDLKRKFPHLASPKVEPTRAAATGARVDDFEQAQVINGRANGYSFKTDVDQIEDQQVTVSIVTDKQGRKFTRAVFKVRPETGRKLYQDQLGTAKKGLQAIDPNELGLDGKIEEAIRGILAQLRDGNPLRAKDLERVAEATKLHREIRDKIVGYVRTKQLAKAELDKFDQRYSPWKQALVKMVEPGAGVAANPLPQGLGFFEKGLFRTQVPSALEEGAKPAGLAWERKSGAYRYHEASFDNANQVETGTLYSMKGNQGGRYVSEFKTPGGTKAKVTHWSYNEGSSYAIEGTTHIDIAGVGEEATAAVFEAMEAMGLNSKRSTVENLTELYLDRMAYASTARRPNLWEDFKRADGIANQEERIKAKLEWFEDTLDVKVTETQAWADTRDGVYQAFNGGRFQQYRADLEADLPEFSRNYVVYHNTEGISPSGTSGHGTWQSVERIVGSGGQIRSQVERVRMGIRPPNTSPDSDMNVGGGNYVYLRVQARRKMFDHTGIYWKPRQATRVDGIHYPGDRYGKVYDSQQRSERAMNLSEYAKWSDRDPYNELILKDGLSIYDDVSHIVLYDKAEWEIAVKHMKAKGFGTWPDGRRVEDVLTYRNREVPISW